MLYNNHLMMLLACAILFVLITADDPKKSKKSAPHYPISFKVISGSLMGMENIPSMCSYVQPQLEKITKFGLSKSEPFNACSEIPEQSGEQKAILSHRGDCNFVQKTCAISKAGGSIAFIMDNQDQGFLTLGGELPKDCKAIPSCTLPKDIGTQIVEALKTENSLTIQIEKYVPPVFDPTMAIMWAWACLIVTLGSLYATQETSTGGTTSSQTASGSTGTQRSQPQQDDETQVLNVQMAVGFLFTSSMSLFVLYFFINQLVYFLLVMYGMGSQSALVHITLPYFRKFIASTTMDLPYYGKISRSDFCCHLFFTIIVLYWFITRASPNFWIIQNFMGAAMCMRLQSIIRIPNIRVATYLLGLFFLYDIFFVFITPYIFEKSIMVTVGTGGDSGEKMPMVFAFPRIWGRFGRESMLGLGDVAFPGFLMTYLRSFDVKNKTSFYDGYFLPGILSYGLGLFITMCVLIIFRAAQPALLYLVPCTLGVTYYYAYKRGQFQILWTDQISEIHAYELTEKNELIDVSDENEEGI